MPQYLIQLYLVLEILLVGPWGRHNLVILEVVMDRQRPL